jgi:hypothetical protein
LRAGSERHCIWGEARKYISGFEGNAYDRNKTFYDVGRAILERNFGVTIGRAACEASSAMWNLGTNSAKTEFIVDNI